MQIAEVEILGAGRVGDRAAGRLQVKGGFGEIERLFAINLVSHFLSVGDVVATNAKDAVHRIFGSFTNHRDGAGGGWLKKKIGHDHILVLQRFSRRRVLRRGDNALARFRSPPLDQTRDFGDASLSTLPDPNWISAQAPTSKPITVILAVG